MNPSNKACAACSYARQKCTPSCLFQPHLPNDDPRDAITFDNINNLFGRAKVLKLLTWLQPHQRHDAMTSIIYEANAWADFPGLGCVHYISMLVQQVVAAETELADLEQQINFYKMLKHISDTFKSNNSSSNSWSLDLNVHPRCAACAYENQDCKLDCPLQHCFTYNDENITAYIKVRKWYGYNNVLNMVRDVEHEQRDQTIKSIIFQADEWDKHPGQGCIPIVNELQGKLTGLNQQLACLKGQTNHESLGESSLEDDLAT